MSSESNPRLPVIDFNNPDLEANPNEWEAVKSQVHRALIQFGCFEALFDKVPSELRKSFFAALEELFDLPLETKLRIASKKPFQGYVGKYPKVPNFEGTGVDDAKISENVEILTQILWPEGKPSESMSIDDANNSKNVEIFTQILWPEGKPSFSKTIHSYSKRVSELDQIVRRMILESLGVEKYMEEHMNSTTYLLRFMKYKGPQTSDTKLRLGMHTDKNIVTILCQNQVDGLEVQTKDGEWIKYKPSHDGFVVIIGDCFYAWANGRLHAPFHRVMMSGNEARYSAGLFTAPKGRYVIKAPEELVDKEHPRIFKPFNHTEFMKFYYTEEGQKVPDALKAYCGA